MNKEETGGTDAAANSADTDKLYENRGPKTIVRLMTVGAYMFSVSCAALALSGYYIFFWHPPNSRLIHAHAAHLRTDNEMDFMAADSLTIIRVDKSNQSELIDKFHGINVNNRYKYVSNFNEKNASQNFIFAEDDERWRKQNEQENRGYNSVNKMDTTKKIDSNQEIRNQQSINDKDLTIENTNFPRNNTITKEKINKPLDNSMLHEKSYQEKSKITDKKFNYLNSDNVKIFKKFLKTL
ncbi:uncharacterized protein LOC127280991 [Leptopilina boulardi]|uniref:uncharacterized protein LOC127280991 n=1 Tax=Leptopilina boulardi TaxID=63433 RepID=UPI0021F5FAEE|nr:uncharacterized protein LOC127280991 [Leptopilina boulardi]